MDAKRENENIEGIREFLEKLEKDPEFRKKFEDLIISAHRENSKDLLHEMVKFINAEGFTYSLEDLTLLMQKIAALSSEELSDEELKAVTGGSYVLNGIMSAFRNIFKSTVELSNAFNKLLQDLPKRLINIFPK